MARLVTLRRSDLELSDKKSISIVNTPLPPIPTDKKFVPPESTSNRSSSSGSSVYGQLIPEDPPSDEDIYSRPVDSFSFLPPPLTQRRLVTNAPPVPSRPWSVAGSTDPKVSADRQSRSQSRSSNEYTPMQFGNQDDNSPKFQKGHFRSKTASPKLPTKYAHTPTDPLRNSWSETMNCLEEAPPLPPRLNERRATTSGINEEIPPALPKRLSKKTSASSLLIGDILAVDINLENDVSRSSSPDLTCIGPPPPIPLKKNLSSPSSASSPVGCDSNHQLTPISNPTTPILSPTNSLGYSVASGGQRSDLVPLLPSTRPKPPPKTQHSLGKEKMNTYEAVAAFTPSEDTDNQETNVIGFEKGDEFDVLETSQEYSWFGAQKQVPLGEALAEDDPNILSRDSGRMNQVRRSFSLHVRSDNSLPHLSARELHLQTLAELQRKENFRHPGCVYPEMIPEPDYSDSDDDSRRPKGNMKATLNGHLTDDGLIVPKKLSNPCVESKDRQNLHKELLFNQKIGKNVLNQKSELQKNDEPEVAKKSSDIPEFLRVHAKVRARMDSQ
uniref:SH3 domain-containing protein n=1 Tax=Strigamia maritima TaxID=126957 RepID=T1IUW6_STRMM